MPITSPGNDDDTGENHQPTLRKNTAEPVEQTLKQNTRPGKGTRDAEHVEHAFDAFPGEPAAAVRVEHLDLIQREALFVFN